MKILPTLKNNKDSYKATCLCTKQRHLVSFIHEKQCMNTCSYIATSSPSSYTSIMQGTKEPEKQTNLQVNLCVMSLQLPGLLKRNFFIRMPTFQ